MDFNKNIPEIEKKIRYTFKDKSLLTQAFTRSSYCNEHRTEGKRSYISNEILEFFGDSVLSTAIISILLKDKTERYEHGVYTELNEGDFSNIRSKLSDKRNLSLSMSSLGLQKYLIMGEGDAKLGIENEPSVMEDLFESIIGAVYIDCGMDISRVIKVVSGMLDVKVYFAGPASTIQSHKNSLQEWCADKKHRLPSPIYKTVSVSGPDHKRVYERAVLIGDRTVATGKGKNQKLADSAAAEAALAVLKGEDLALDAPDLGALTRLRALAQRNKQPSPEFRDLGETQNSTSVSREYMIECRCMGEIESAKGKSKQDARALSAAAVLSKLEKRARKEKAEKMVKEQQNGRQKKKAPKNAKKSDKVASPKRAAFQHKKHL